MFLFFFHLIFVVQPGGVSSSDGCNSGWKGYEDSCYWFESRVDRSWHEAYDACTKKGAHLVSIESREEYNWLRSNTRNFMGKKSDRELIWTSGHRDFSTDVWFWDDGTERKIEDIAWYPGQPSNDYGVEFYLALMYLDGQWGMNDSPENYELQSICEKPRSTLQWT